MSPVPQAVPSGTSLHLVVLVDGVQLSHASVASAVFGA
jgi:hypothetical protein